MTIVEKDLRWISTKGSEKTMWCLMMFGRTPGYCKAMIVWLYRFPGCILSVSTAAIEVEQSTPAFKTARTLARMLSKKRLIERHITCYHPVQSCPNILFLSVDCHVWCPFAPVSNHVKRLRGSVQTKTPERLVAEIVEAWLVSQHMKQCHYKMSIYSQYSHEISRKSFFENRESYLFQL